MNLHHFVLPLVSLLVLSRHAKAAQPDATAGTPEPGPPEEQVTAENVTPAPVPEQSPDHAVALTLSPFELLSPIVQVTGEVKLHRKIGLGLTLGAGSVPLYGIFHGGDRLLALKAALSFNGYAVGHFDHGLVLGAGVTAVKVSGEVEHDENGRAIPQVSGSGEGLGVFGHIGYKRTLPVGFTYGFRLGLGYLFAHASAANTSTRADLTQQGAYALGDVQIGWAF